ncbi:uncharacterized protein LOC126971925 [Leptidea sinapis]|uniref:uncharacterized protein LOC126971925 n=1 Tax=Leptidea sinapis TaxID=189913 RepID=UPI0021C3F385|nr:uncharacterized protein LOC126971925 [Leptidea sinapis]
MASFGRGSTKPDIPFVFLPLKGQIIYPSKEIIFTDVEDSVCAVTSAQYLSVSGWVTLRDLLDNDVPFGLYRDEGSTYLQWRGSAALHSRLEGRLVAAHVLCSAPPPSRLATSCAVFRIAGATHNSLLDVKSIPFHAGETISNGPHAQSRGLSVLESLAIGVCVFILVFIYAAGIMFYIHYKQKQKHNNKDPENHSNTSDNGSTLDSRINIDVRMKTNPLMKIENMRNEYSDPGLSDVSELTEDTIESVPKNNQKERTSNTTSAIVHSKRKKPCRTSVRASSTPERLTDRLQRRSASPEMERAPHSDLSILHCSIDNNAVDNIPSTPDGEPVVRRKLYFNPVFFETEHLKNPPPAAIEFLSKLREVMTIAKDKMTSKRFIPNLSDIPEEESYHTIDLGWDIPCARQGRRFSAISLKRENSRRAIHCGGCPGCDNTVRGQKALGLNRSNSCKTCVSDDYKQKIVQKWLDDVPLPSVNMSKAKKSIAKVSGTPRVVETKEKDDTRLNPAEPLRDDETETLVISESILKEIIYDSHVKSNEIEILDKSGVTQNANNSVKNKRSPSNHATRRVRKKLPPPPPPPSAVLDENRDNKLEPVLPEVKMKMEAVIRELNKCQRTDSDIKELPKIIIPIVEADHNFNGNLSSEPNKKEFYLQRPTDVDSDSLERGQNLKRRFSLDFDSEYFQNEGVSYQQQLQMSRERLSQSWRDLKQAIDSNFSSLQPTVNESNRFIYSRDIFAHNNEPIYNNISRPGPLTIEVRGSPVDNRKKESEDFDPDTLDRKPKKHVDKNENENKKCVEKILLKSGGSFKNKLSSPNNKPPSPEEAGFTRKIGSLRQIYEAKTRAQDSQFGSFYERRGSIQYDKKSEFVRNVQSSDKSKSSIPPKQKYNRESPPKDPKSECQRSEEKDIFPTYSKNENLNARRSGRRSARTRSRKIDLKKLPKTEDSGYLSTDSNESKRRAKYLLQLKPKVQTPQLSKPVPVLNKGLQIESDTDELESLCDGRSESGGESVETDSVFFGNIDSKRIYEELGLNGNRSKRNRIQEQRDSGFAGETIILSGDSDSEHKSVISIVTGRDGRTSAKSISNLNDPPYVHSVEC